jgi:hypothetical protein
MNTRFTKVSWLVVLTGMLASSSAMAQSYVDGGSKARGDFGQLSRSQARMTYRAGATSAQRSFSYEPAPNVAQQSQSTGNSGRANSDSNKTSANTQPSAPQGNVAQRGEQNYRAYSYEPGMSNGTTRSRSGSTPLWALPKSDSRKFGGQ